MKKIRVFNRNTVPRKATVISSYAIYKIKINDDKSLKPEACLELYGINDSDKKFMKSDCCMCSPIKIRIILSITSLKLWRLARVDVKLAFLHACPAQNDGYVIPLHECRRREEL